METKLSREKLLKVAIHLEGINQTLKEIISEMSPKQKRGLEKRVNDKQQKIGLP